MKKLTKSILQFSFLLLAACANHQAVVSDAANKCPQVGINVDAPDFYQTHQLHDTESFYSCMESQLKPDPDSPLLGRPGSPARNMFNNNDKIKTALQPALEYQRNLWRQVLNKEKSPGAAYDAWARWSQNERSVEASKQAADDAASAAYRSNQAAQQQQFQTNFQLQQQNMQLQQMQQQQFINNSMNSRY